MSEPKKPLSTEQALQSLADSLIKLTQEVRKNQAELLKYIKAGKF